MTCESGREPLFAMEMHYFDGASNVAKYPPTSVNVKSWTPVSRHRRMFDRQPYLRVYTAADIRRMGTIHVGPRE